MSVTLVISQITSYYTSVLYLITSLLLLLFIFNMMNNFDINMKFVCKMYALVDSIITRILIHLIIYSKSSNVLTNFNFYKYSIQKSDMRINTNAFISYLLFIK